MELSPPEDPTITTLWLGNVDADLNEGDLREVIYPYGHIQNIHMARAGKCAFVEFASREMAENAAKELYRACMVKGKVISINWAKPRAQAYVEGGGVGSNGGAGSGEEGSFAMLPPPGMEKAPSSSYVLPGMPQPFLQPPAPFGLPPSSSGAGGSSYFINQSGARPPPPFAPTTGQGQGQGQGQSLGLGPGYSTTMGGIDNQGQDGVGVGIGIGGVGIISILGSDAVVGMKRPAEMAIASGLDLGPHQGQGQGHQQKRPQHQSQGPLSLYPSMNPSRMGAKI